MILLAYSSADVYLARYREPDKSGSGLGEGTERWPVPYWVGDAAFGVMSVLLGAVDAGLGACILGCFRGESELAAALGVPQEWRLFCAVALGRPDGHDHRSASLDRPAPGPEARVHRGGGEWGASPRHMQECHGRIDRLRPGPGRKELPPSLVTPPQPPRHF